MSVRIKYKSDNFIELNGTVDEGAIPRTAITVASGGSCLFRLFDDRKDTRLSADEASGQTILSVDNARNFEVDDELYIELDSGSYDTLAVTELDVEAKTITVEAPGLATLASKSARLSVLLGSSVNMPEYGTPIVGKFDWGWRGVVTDTHVGLRVGMKLRIEIELDGGANLQLREILSVFVDGGT